MWINEPTFAPIKTISSTSSTATIQAILGRYEEAAEMLETAVSAPSHAVSTSLLQVDAYKRLILVQLLKDRKTSPLPRYTSSNLVSSFKSLYTQTYLDFAKNYEKLDRVKIQEIYKEHSKSYEADGNLGLIERCLEEIPAMAILKLKNVFKVLEIDDVVELVGLYKGSSGLSVNGASEEGFTDMNKAREFAASTIRRIISTKQLSATMTADANDPSKLTIEFLPLSSDKTSLSAKLQQSLNALSQSSALLTSLDKQITTSREFLTKASQAGSKGLGGDIGVGVIHESMMIGDEDLGMGDDIEHDWMN